MFNLQFYCVHMLLCVSDWQHKARNGYILLLLTHCTLDTLYQTRRRRIPEALILHSADFKDLFIFSFLFHNRHVRPSGPPSLLYDVYRGSCPGLKRPGRGVDHSSPIKPLGTCMACYLYNFNLEGLNVICFI